MKKNRITSVVVAAVIATISAFNSIGTVTAATVESKEQTYLNDAVAAYLDSNNISDQNVRISQPFDYYDLKSGQSYGHEYIVYSNDEAKGLLYVNEMDGKYYSSFRTATEELAEELENDKEFAFGYYGDETVLISDDEYYNSFTGKEIEEIENVKFSNSIDTKEIRTKNISANKSTKSTVRKANSKFPTRSFECKLNVPAVSNDIVFDEDGNGRGICWAASIAAKHNYKYGKTSNMTSFATAMKVWRIVRDANEDPDPVGNPDNTEVGLACMGLDYTYKYGTLNMSQVYKELSNNNPIIISVSGQFFDPDNDISTSGHSLVLSGVKYDSARHNGTYTFMDCNYPTPITVFVEPEAVINGDKFMYTSDLITNMYGTHFNKWYQTYSYKYA